MRIVAWRGADNLTHLQGFAALGCRSSTGREPLKSQFQRHSTTHYYLSQHEL